MNWFGILKFSLIHFVTVTLAGSLITLLIGSENLVHQNGRDFLIYLYLPTFIVGTVTLTFFAKMQSARVLLHLIITVVLSSIVSATIISALMGGLYISPTWFIDLPISATSIVTAQLLGRYFRGLNKVNQKLQLKSALIKAAKYFEKRSLDEWNLEVNYALQKLDKNDYSFVESLWLKYAPTCEIDDLIIIDYSPEDEYLVNQLNDELAEIANEAFSALDKFKSTK